MYGMYHFHSRSSHSGATSPHESSVYLQLSHTRTLSSLHHLNTQLDNLPVTLTMAQTIRIPIRTEKAPLPPPFLSQGIKVGNMIYCSGQVGVDPTTGKMVEGPIQARTKQILHNLSAVLEAGGSSLQDVVKVNIFLADMGDFAAVNEVYQAAFGEPKPARTCVAVKTLPLGTDVEIECSAVVTGVATVRDSRL
ncbi:YjgF-like protein [Aspergillus fumigatus]